MALCASPGPSEPMGGASATAALTASESHRSSLSSQSAPLVRGQSASTAGDASTTGDAEPEQQRGARGRGRGRGGRRKIGEDASDDVDNADEADNAVPQKRARGGSTSSTARADTEAEKILRYQGSLAHALSAMAQAERREERERLRRDSRRLGNFRRGLYGRSQDRDAAVQWEGGTEEEDIEILKKRIEDQRRQVEEMKKAFSKPPKARQRAGQTLEEVEEETWEQRELCNAKSDAAKRYETELADRVRRLTVERSEHLRLYRMVEEEDKLSFGSFQPLRKRYQLLRLLSRSSSTEIYKAHDLKDLIPCLVKIHHLNFDSKVDARQEHLGHINSECEAYKQLKCQNIAMLLDHFAVEEGSKYATIWEFCEGDSFEAYVCRHSPVPEKEARGVLLQILSFLRYVESKGYPSKNLDLKPNRLTLRGGEVKFTGIGFSHLRGVKEIRRARSTLEVASDSLPLESQEDPLDGSEGSSSVVLMSGTIMFELLFGRPPEVAVARAAPAESSFSIASPSWAEPVQFPESPRISVECREFLSRLLDRDRRVTVQQAYSDPFMAAPSRKWQRAG
mmetsp:Transcript_158668/g.280255  ORF Transcript_158668/g.280255 Transcript_158668/m.280255 type:complete len:566 (+) Transcript_158668:128-1825(+)